MKTQWQVIIRGLVTRPAANKRNSVPHGLYLMEEAGVGKYALSRDGKPLLEVTLQELTQYVRNGALTFPDSDWP